MKKIAMVIVGMVLPFTFAGCEEEICPEGQEYTSQYEYHYGYNVMTGKYEFFFGPVSECRPI